MGVDRRGSAATEEKKNSLIWVNVGYETAVPREDGNGNYNVTLPFGIPIDSMQECRIPSQESTFQLLQLQRNDLLAKIREQAAKLADGEEIKLTLSVFLRKNMEPSTLVNSADNPFAMKGGLVAK